MSQLLDPATLQVVTYPHPTLRRQSKPIRRVDAHLHSTIRRMFELMYQSNGVGLAANQVNLPLRLFVANLKADPEEGEEMVFINPIISRPKGSDEAEEGCLSLPELYGNVVRPKRVHMQAYTPSGDEISLDVEGLLARVLQHETDHLDGILFPDRMSVTGQLAIEATLDEFSTEFSSRRDLGEIPSDQQIETRLCEWEQRYC